MHQRSLRTKSARVASAPAVRASRGLNQARPVRIMPDVDF
jgi:hypothetical protein